nr:MAG TPA: hypothetical protein [Caudoviricetes sp.]
MHNKTPQTRINTGFVALFYLLKLRIPEQLLCNIINI